MSLFYSNVYAQSGKTYTCTTTDGRKLIADNPIRECADRQQFIKGSSGATIAIVPPQLTPRQQNLLQAERDRQEQIFKREKEQLIAVQQYQRILRERYPTLAAHEKMREQETGPILKKIDEIKTNLSAHKTKYEELNTKVSAYPNPDKAPPDLIRDYEYVTHEMATQERFLKNLEQQLQKINERYKTDLLILEPYWKSQRASSPKQ